MSGVSLGKIAFVSCREDAHGRVIVTRDDTTCSLAIYVMDPDGGNQIELGPSFWQAIMPVSTNSFCWSPDGKRIAFVDSTYESEYHSWLCLIDADGANLSKLEMPGMPRAISWSPDGRKIAVDLLADIYIVDIDTGEAKNLTNTPDIEEALPSWSPDDKRIAFLVWHHDSSTDDITSSDICLMDADGSKRVTLISQPGMCTLSPLAWSPDGRKIVYVCRPLPYPHVWSMTDIYSVDTKNGKTVKLTDNPDFNDRDPSWSPDGKKIVFASGGQICVMNADGSHLTKLTTDVGFSKRFPSLSPDSKKICFRQIDNETQASDICIMDADGSNIINLTGDTPGDDNYCLWSPR
ncbi:unnamed protein product [marine sediment metagenome]|uniref:Dipeptidylpeptidase IV N-terminal domain-containing protein n=1 Tax=marine sediment metagenome TaxID=412755 RepID=X1ASW8_9ZZZZ